MCILLLLAVEPVPDKNKQINKQTLTKQRRQQQQRQQQHTHTVILIFFSSLFSLELDLTGIHNGIVGHRENCASLRPEQTFGTITERNWICCLLQHFCVNYLSVKYV